ncbi:DASH complex, subunit Dad1 [Niveomyces insectorum RCEF 264]|uniref:DASH complex subunit DAD1 n=1 Tax=Niveomyces insectorum RCEF 264 TaxID=1081102 RepID=A0A167NRF7_9HYPO|nr:DASH complex, subunit Dad1 [Niveomyces insectorum RCEF 264]
MSTTTRGAGGGAGGRAQSYFEQQRELLLGEIAMVGFSVSFRLPLSALLPSADTTRQSFEQVLANLNKLNRSLEAVVTVGNEFSSVEALWSQFEGVMAKDEAPAPEQAAAAAAGDERRGKHADDEREEGQTELDEEADENQRGRE